MAELTDVLKTVVSSGASDLHLVVGKPPMARLQGLMTPVPEINPPSPARIVLRGLDDAKSPATAGACTLFTWFGKSGIELSPDRVCGKRGDSKTSPLPARGGRVFHARGLRAADTRNIGAEALVAFADLGQCTAACGR